MGRAALLLLALAGCGSGSVPTTLGARAWPSDEMAVVATVEIDLPPGTTRVSVEHGDDRAYGRGCPPQAVAGDAATARVLVLGLTPGATNHLRAWAWAGDAPLARSVDLTLAAPPLPGSFPALTGAAPGAPPATYLLLSAPAVDLQSGFGIVSDWEGRPYWYVSAVTGPNANFLGRHPDGAFTYLRSSDYGFVEAGLHDVEVRRWSSPAATRGANGHDALFAAGDAVLLGYADAGAGMLVDTVDRVAADGTARFHWQTDAYAEGESPFRLNAVDATPGGDLLVSLLFTGEVLRLDAATGDTVWRLGGASSSFSFVDDPLGGPSGQHTVRALGETDVLLFDNGVGHDPPVSRAVQYRLDAAAGTATLVWEHRRDPASFSMMGGSVRRLENGHTLVAWMSPGAVSEVDADGAVVRELTASTPVFRAEPLAGFCP
jgi:hypothetical protein